MAATDAALERFDPCGDEVLGQQAVSILLAGVAPDQGTRLHPTVGSAVVDRLLTTWQILPSISDPVMGVLAKLLPAQDHTRLERARLAVIAFQQAQVAAARPLLQALERSEFRYSLLKGAAAGCVLYPERHMRASWDIDIGVAWGNLAEIEALAIEEGRYHQAEREPAPLQFFRANRRLRQIVEREHYELGFLARRVQVTNLSAETREAIRVEPWTHQFWHDADTDAPWCYAVVDIHHAISLDIGLEDLLDRARPVVIAGDALKVPDLPWMAAYTTYKLYWEGVHNYGKGLYQYADFVRLAPLLGPQEFQLFVDILERHNILIAGYYVLRRLNRFGVDLPEYMMEFVLGARDAPRDSEPVNLNDLGDVWPKLWGIR